MLFYLYQMWVGTYIIAVAGRSEEGLHMSWISWPNKKNPDLLINFSTYLTLIEPMQRTSVFAPVLVQPDNVTIV